MMCPPCVWTARSLPAPSRSPDSVSIWVLCTCRHVMQRIVYVKSVRWCLLADSEIISVFAQCDSEHGEEGRQDQRPEAEMDFEGGPGRAAGHEPCDTREGHPGPMPSDGE